MTNSPQDLGGREIKLNDWVVQSMSLGRCAAIKFAYVVGFSAAGSPRMVSFEEYRTGDGNWRRKGPYSIINPERSFVIPATDIPESLQRHIEDNLRGDPTWTDNAL